MELKLVKKDIYNESDYAFFEDDMIHRCNELLEEKNLPLVTFKLWYYLSYSQSSWVWFREFNISFNEIIKYLLEVKTLTQIEYDILYSAHHEWLYDFNYTLWYWNKIWVNTSIYKIEDTNSTRTTYELLTKKYWDHYTDDDWVISWDALDDILDSDQIELALKELMDSICYDLKDYWYKYIESEDEYECKNILFDTFMELNNIETNIEYYEWWEYIKTKQELLELNIPIETYTRINDNNLDDYYISNDIINSIELKERTVEYYLLTI